MNLGGSGAPAASKVVAASLQPSARAFTTHRSIPAAASSSRAARKAAAAVLSIPEEAVASITTTRRPFRAKASAFIWFVSRRALRNTSGA